MTETDDDRDPRGVEQEATARSGRLRSSRVRSVPVGDIQSLQAFVVEAGLRVLTTLSRAVSGEMFNTGKCAPRVRGTAAADVEAIGEDIDSQMKDGKGMYRVSNEKYSPTRRK